MFCKMFLLFSIGCLINILAEGQAVNCRTSSNLELVRESKFYQNLDHHDNFLNLPPLNENTSCKVSLQNLEGESLQKVQELQNNKEFQETVAEFQNKIHDPSNTPPMQNRESQGNLHIFVSFSMGEKVLLNLAHEAKYYGATLVLRGLKEGSSRKTAQALQEIITKTGQGVLIDPELYTLFNIAAVPTFILAKPFQLHSQERTQTPLHDKLQGHVSVRYALETFAKEGDLKQEAKLLLKGTTP